MASFSRTIGIVGGAGPMASAFLYTSILEICQKQYNANDYNEFPEIVLVSYPFTRGNEEKIRNEISLCLSKLKNAGASLFSIASNSLHGFLPDLPKAGFVNLVAEGLKEATHQNVSKALILAAPMTINKINDKVAQEIWKVTRRTTTTRLKEMCQEGLLAEISTSSKDPQKVFVLPKHRK